MPLIESAPDNVARIYAKSLVDLVEAKGGVAAIETAQTELQAVLDVARQSPAFSEFLSSRVVPTQRRADSLEKMFKGRLADTTYKFLQVLNDKGRLSHLAPIVAAIDGAVQEKFGRVEIDVFTAQALSPDAQQAMRQRLSDALKCEVVLHAKTDDSMIGGVKLQVGDQLVDGSVATRLRQMRDQIERDGAARIRGSLGSMLA